MKKSSSITLFSITAASLVAIAGPAFATRGGERTCTSAAPAEWRPIADVEAAITKQGYEIVKTERKGACYEFHARKDDRQYELYVDPATSEIVRTKSR